MLLPVAKARPGVMGLSLAFAALACWAAWPSRAAAQNAQWGIFVMKSDGSQAHLLAQVDGCTVHARPRWSPDGKQIVFDAESAATRQNASYLVNADGTGLKRLGDFGYARWTPDNKQLVFQFGGQSSIQNLDGEGRTQIAAGGSPCLSPDGSLLAVRYQDNIQVTNLVTGDTKTLFASPKETIYYGFSWFPDGKRLAVVARPAPRKSRELLYVSAEGEEHGLHVRMTGEMAGFISFSPDGKMLAIDSSYKVRLLDAEGTSKPILLPGQKGANRDPDWSPDGEWIVFASSRDPD